MLLCLAILYVLGSAGVADELELSLRGPAETVQVLGHALQLEAVLINRSSRPIKVVKPGDGSESGWREPYLFYTAERRKGEMWEQVPAQPIFRCGLFNTNWPNDVVVLKSGESLPLNSGLVALQTVFALSPGVYRFRLHYRYSQGKNDESRAGHAIPDSLRGVKPFEVVSSPLELRFVESAEERHGE